MNIGIIGVGKWGKNLLKTFHDIPDVNVKRCSNKHDVGWLEKTYPEIISTLNYNDILSDPDIDAVIISVPHSYLYQVTKDSILSGKHVFVEKPMASTYQEASDLISLKRECQVLFIGYRFAYDPIYKMLIDILKDDPATNIEFNWNKFGTFGNDIFLNLASHEISLALLFFDDFPISTVLKESSSDSCTFKLKFSDNRFARISINRLYPKTNKTVKILTASRRLLYWIDNCLYELDRHNNQYKVVYMTYSNNLEDECSAFISSVRNNTESDTNCILAYDVLRVISRIKEDQLSFLKESNINRMCNQVQNLPTINILTLFPTFVHTVDPYSFLDGTSSPVDIAVLKAFSQKYTYCKYLEIGTWRGESIANICNIVDKSVSVDLSEDELQDLGYSKEKLANMRFFLKNNDNIKFINQNSQDFDFSKLDMKFDLIFVDGAHDYQSVRKDTENVFSLLKDESSVIVWHDYLSSAGKVRKSVLAGILEGCPVKKRKDLYHISNTLCAVYISSESEFDVKIENSEVPNKSFEVRIKGRII